MSKEDTIVGLDIGTSKTAICVGVSQEGIINIAALGKVPNNGMRKGHIVDIEETVSSISAAIEDAERVAGIPLDSAYVNISGVEIASAESRGVVAVSRADGEITETDVIRVVEAARSVALPPNHEIIHIIPKSYVVDGQSGVKEPVGMSGVRLEVNAQVIGIPTSLVKNLTKCVNQTGLEIVGLVFSGLAAARTLLNKKQKEIGVMLLDIGAATTTMAVFEEGDLIHAQVIPVGSSHITNDLAIGLRTTLDVAEKIKTEAASVDEGKINEEIIDLSQFSPQETEKPAKKYVAEIIIARLNEIFNIVKEELKKIDKEGMLPAGVVLTGGGSRLDGLVSFVKNNLKLPAQTATPLLEVSGMVDKIDDPSYAVAEGLMLDGFESDNKKSAGKIDVRDLGGIVGRAKNIFKKFLP